MQHKIVYKNDKVDAVNIMGEFNDWKEEPMLRKGDQFEIVLEKMEKSQYKLVVDGQFVLDETKEIATNQGWNCNNLG